MENNTICLRTDFSLGPHQEEDVRVLLEGEWKEDFGLAEVGKSMHRLLDTLGKTPLNNPNETVSGERMESQQCAQLFDS